MSALNQKATNETREDITDDSETALEELCRLDDNSDGKWVRCICTEVNEDRLIFRFETVHSRSLRKSFDVPRTFEESPIQSFFERVGYAPENASLMEGDGFWMHMKDERVVDEPPSGVSRWLRLHVSLPSLHHGDLNIVFKLVGGAILMPIGGVSWVLWEMSDDGEGEPWFAFIISTMVTMLWAVVGYGLMTNVVLG